MEGTEGEWRQETVESVVGQVQGVLKKEKLTSKSGFAMFKGCSSGVKKEVWSVRKRAEAFAGNVNVESPGNQSRRRKVRLEEDGRQS